MGIHGEKYKSYKGSGHCIVMRTSRTSPAGVKGACGEDWAGGAPGPGKGFASLSQRFNAAPVSGAVGGCGGGLSSSGKYRSMEEKASRPQNQQSCLSFGEYQRQLNISSLMKKLLLEFKPRRCFLFFTHYQGKCLFFPTELTWCSPHPSSCCPVYLKYTPAKPLFTFIRTPIQVLCPVSLFCCWK